MYTEMVGLKAEKQLPNKNRIEDWAIDCQPRDNGQVLNLKYLYIIIKLS